MLNRDSSLTDMVWGPVLFLPVSLDDCLEVCHGVSSRILLIRFVFRMRDFKSFIFSL